MAEEALKKLEEQLHCAICLGTYTDPKQLQCQHTYCRECLVRLNERNPQGKLSVTCPNCRQVTPFAGDEGVGGLQPAFQINNLLEIQETFKKAKSASGSREEAESKVSPVGEELESAAVHSASSAAYCSEHGDEELKLYCNTCEMLICLKCGIKGAQHQSHDYLLLEKAYEQYKESILLSLAPVEDQLVTVEKALQRVDEECGEISQQTAITEKSIHDAIDRFQKVLDGRKTELIGQLHQIAQRKLKSLGAQRDLLEIDQLQLEQCVSGVMGSFKTGDKHDAMKTKTAKEKQVKDLTEGFQPNTFELCTEADIAFSTTTDIPAVCQNFGSVQETKKLRDPSQRSSDFKGMKSVELGERATVVVQAIDCSTDMCKALSKDVKCNVVSEITHAVIEATVERNKQGEYVISYEPAVQGCHQLHFKIGGQHISGSPFPVHVKLPRTKLGVPVSSINGLKGPWGVAVNQKGEIFVSEHEGHCISVFSPTGEKLRSFGSYGSGEGEFKNPRGITLDKEGNVIVTDFNNHRVQKFASDGTFLATVGSSTFFLTFSAGSPTKFRHPKAISFNSSNDKLYVVDELNRIHILNLDLSSFTTFTLVHNVMGSVVVPATMGLDPWGISCDSSGNVYIATSNYHYIQVFTAEGKFLRVFGNRGKKNERLSFPVGVYIDESNTVYITERHNHRVSLFTTEGEYIRSFGDHGKKPGQLSYPRGLTVDQSGVVYVCDNNNNRVTLF